MVPSYLEMGVPRPMVPSYLEMGVVTIMAVIICYFFIIFFFGGGGLHDYDVSPILTVATHDKHSINCKCDGVDGFGQIQPYFLFLIALCFSHLGSDSNTLNSAVGAVHQGPRRRS